MREADGWVSGGASRALGLVVHMRESLWRTRREAVSPAPARAEGGSGAGGARRIGEGSVHHAALEAAAAGSAGDDLLAGREEPVVEVEERVSRAIAHVATDSPKHVGDMIVPEAE